MLKRIKELMNFVESYKYFFLSIVTFLLSILMKQI